MIAQVILQLQASLKDPTIGIGSGIAMVAAVNGFPIPTIRREQIYALDAPEDVMLANLPALILSPVGTGTDESRSQRVRDSVHDIGIEYATDEPDENEWRRHAMYVAEALMWFLDSFNANDEDYVGDSGVIVVLDWTMEYMTWRQPPNTVRGFALTVRIAARDVF